MKNLNLVIDAPIILSGYLAPYFTEEDIEYLTEHLHTAAPFILDKTQILSVPTDNIHRQSERLCIM